LNSISIIAQRLKTEFNPPENNEEYNHFLSVISREISRISSIIEDFLKYARPPQLVLTTVRLEELIADVVKVVSEKARAQNIEIIADMKPGIICRCDFNQMKQAMLNIVLNALEAIVDHGTVYISAEKKKGEVIIKVKDTGSGIPQEILSNIFEPYFTTKEQGTGLGLSEVYRIISAHGGRVTAENTRDMGAVFSIYIPVDHQNHSEKQKAT